MSIHDQDCPICEGIECVNCLEEYQGVHTLASSLCRCDDCGSTFEIDFDADYDGDGGYRDCSTVGRRVNDDGTPLAKGGVS